MPSKSQDLNEFYESFINELRKFHLLKDKSLWRRFLFKEEGCTDTSYCVLGHKHDHKSCTGFGQYFILEGALRCLISYANMSTQSDQEYLSIKSQVIKNCYKFLERTKMQMLKIPEDKRVAPVDVGLFEFVRPLTRGAYGQIFLLKQRSNDSLLAAKILSISEAQRLTAVSSFLAERNILFQCNQLKSPYLIDMRYSFRSDFFLFLICEYVDGGDLSCWLERKGKFSIRETQIIASQLILALTDVQKLEIVHGDVKPENIIYSRRTSAIKLIDFGLSFCRQVSTGATCRGTPEYMAPEQISSNQKSFASDLWALGICLYEFLTGKPLFYDDEPENILLQIAQFTGCIDWSIKDPENLITTEGRDLIILLLNPNPMNRPALQTIKKHSFFTGITCVEPLTFIEEVNFDDRNLRYANGIRFYSTAILESESVYLGKSQEPVEKDLALYYPLQALYRC